MRCTVSDHVETDLVREAEAYREAGIAFSAHQLRGAGAPALIEACGEAEILVVDQARINAEVIAGLARCRLIIRHGDGYDNLDVEAATEAGIICANEPGFWSREAAEQAFAMAMAAALRIPLQQEIARAPRTGTDAGWELSRAMPYRSFSALTVGVVGYGKIGAHAVELFSSAAGRVLVHDPYVDKAVIGSAGAEAVSLEQLTAESDIVSLHLPATEETRRLFDAERIATMKPGAILINTARGVIVDTEAAADALAEGRLGGVALDTTDPEPLDPGHRLFSLPNAIITPHLGWYSETALDRMRAAIIREVIAFSRGTLPASVLNPEVLDSPKLRFSAQTH